MAVQITIIGLGQIGASLGLALADRKDILYRVGHDRDLGVARRAEKKGALDKVMLNLPASVREADLVVLALPADQIRETLEVIAPDLKESAVVMDTGPAKEAVVAWAEELLPPERFYVGLTPILNPAYLHTFEAGVEAARPDLFRGGLMAIVSPRRTPSDAIKLASDLTALVGATPYFADPLEIDGLMAATYTLPHLLSAALLSATLDQPGWREARKVAGQSFAGVSAPIIQPTTPEALRAAVLLNRENMLRVVNDAIAALQAIHGEIERSETEQLDRRFARVQRGRAEWWQQRQQGDWAGEERPATEVPPSSEWFGRLLGGMRKRKDE